jgi:cellulose synthase/poly-beta-1,6-N-acetylglucosamine synthase-like glycosyltransferase
LIKLRRLIKGRRKIPQNLAELPTLTLIVAAYNEEDFIESKIENTLALVYPPEKISYLFVTDGSSDHTPDIIAQHSGVKLLHNAQRRGKINAVHRAMQEVETDIVVFTDANTILNEQALINIARHYADKKVGAVSGEKRVTISAVSDATAGEGFYWKYESTLKKWDAELFSVMGAAGELFSIRTALYEPVESDTILDDFMISMSIVKNGYRIIYEPEAYAMEESSSDTKEELKRKVRIAAGGIQSIRRLSTLLNPLKNFVLSFQYISHRVLRWSVTPFLLILALVLNAFLLNQGDDIYKVAFLCQVLFYTLALCGWVLEAKTLRIKFLFIPYYFCFMNYAVIAGIHRYMNGKQSENWVKAKRKQVKQKFST